MPLSICHLIWLHRNSKRKIDTLIEKTAQPNRFNNSVLAGKNGKFVYEKIFGYQDVRKNIYCNTKPYSSLSGGSIIKNSFPSFSLFSFCIFILLSFSLLYQGINRTISRIDFEKKFFASRWYFICSGFRLTFWIPNGWLLR